MSRVLTTLLSVCLNRVRERVMSDLEAEQRKWVYRPLAVLHPFLNCLTAAMLDLLEKQAKLPKTSYNSCQVSV